MFAPLDAMAFDLGQIGSVVGVARDLGKAVTLKEAEVIKTARLSADQFDKRNRIASHNSKYSRRLRKIVNGLKQYDGLRLNYKVYLSEEVNAFAMPDGTVRIYSGLMDLMTDGEVLAVMGHEIGHVKLKHSFHQMRKQLLTSSAFKTAAAAGGTVGSLTNSALGDLGYAFINSTFSKKDELSADAYAVRFLRSRGKNIGAMKSSIVKLQKRFGSGGGFLSSHPSNSKRIANIQKEMDKL